ncbi:hypothetical protein M407DRAFT_241508 [Tulasnella calospora MUT 4182]|uniref:Uncharacterized protein n=1 Tax=Tulasnella calospora MUT 4182 TaxID=1051891 RepID=A0A0C3MEQ5_9AGAM|nr:hypothetical protein M407DRAFT_241508 [Tulasnella calospora MUT 4182]
MPASYFTFPRVLYYLFWPQLSLLEQWQSPQPRDGSPLAAGICDLVTGETQDHEIGSEDYSWN